MGGVAARVAPGGTLKDVVRTIVPPSFWMVLRTMRQRLVLRTFLPRTVRHQYGAFPLTVRISDPLAAGWYDADWDEPEEIAMLRRYGLRPGARVFDIGAHQGIVAMMLAKAVGDDGLVVAVEGSERNARIARDNIRLNGLNRVEIVHAVAAATDTRLVFDQNLNGAVAPGAGSRNRGTTRGVTLDTLATTYGQPDVLFIDVEGFECEVLAGGATVLASRPDCFVEVHAGGHLQRYGGSIEQLARYFPADDYDLLYARADAGARASAFVPCPAGIPRLEGRFYLLALRRRVDRAVEPTGSSELERRD